MFKLLTEEERQKVASEYGRRRTAVMLLVFSLVLATGLVGLLPSYLLSSAREREVLERTRIIESSGERGDEALLQAWLADVNNKLRTLDPKLDVDRPSVVIERILDQRLAGVRLTGFSWTKTAEGTTLSINGVAIDRQILIAFENSIKASGHFSDVTLPISNLARDKDISFQIKFLPAPTP